MCEDAGIPYVYVESKQALGAAGIVNIKCVSHAAGGLVLSSGGSCSSGIVISFFLPAGPRIIGSGSSF
eukprot:COSAG05_NODE_9017_length_654_cov_1.340541_1_plen_68_part_00